MQGVFKSRTNRQRKITKALPHLAVLGMLLCPVAALVAEKDYYAEAAKSLNANDLDTAVTYLTKAIQKNQKHAAAYHMRGMISLMRGQYKASLGDLSAAIEINKTDPDTFFYRCVAEKNLWNYKAAIADCSVALKMDPKNDQAYNERGLSYYFTGDTASAVKDLDRAIQIRPQPHYYSNRGFVHLNTLKADAAIVDYTKALALGVNDTSVLVNRARALILKKSYKKAREDLDSALKQDPSELSAHINIARIEAINGNLEECKSRLDFAAEHGYSNAYDLERDPEFSELRKTKYYETLMKKINSNQSR
jgi:tetratricopeptide (TPR) repeat protein